MALHACNPALKKQKQEDSKLEASLSYITRVYLKKPKQKPRCLLRRQTSGGSWFKASPGPIVHQKKKNPSQKKGWQNGSSGKSTF
jgi:hypothetical protein